MISSYPAAWIIATAIGVNNAHTATLGRQDEKIILASSHTVICDFMEGPTNERTFRATRLSSPVVAHGIVSKQEPKIRMILPDAY